MVVPDAFTGDAFFFSPRITAEMEAPLVSNARPRWEAKPLLCTTPGVVVISLQCVWLLSFQLEVAHLKQTSR